MRILIAHDLSGRSEPALARGGEIAQARNGQISLMHIIDDEAPESVAEATERSAQQMLQASVVRLFAKAKLQAEIATSRGEPAATIAAEAERLAADLIVIGRPRQRRLQDMIRGTTAERVLRLAHCPVLVAGGMAPFPYKSVLVPVDLSDNSVVALRLASDWLPDAALSVVHAYKGPFQDYVTKLSLHLKKSAKERFAETLREQAQTTMDAVLQTVFPDGYAGSAVLRNGDPEVVIAEELAGQKPELVLLATSARTGLERALIGSVTAAALRHATCDALVIPVRAERS